MIFAVAYKILKGEEKLNFFKKTAGFIAAGAIALSMGTYAAQAAGIQLVYDGVMHLYNGSVYSLYVNNKQIHSPMEPIIFNNHALVPVREIFEACGATVDYNGENKCIEIKYNGMYIRMYINDNTAYINGSKVLIPDNIVPKLINKPGDVTKTMVPVRFISENVGMNVEFSGEDGSIRITTPDGVDTPSYDAPAVETPTAETPVEEPVYETPEVNIPPADQQLQIVGVNYEAVSKEQINVVISFDGNISGRVSHFTLSNPERVVVDVSNTMPVLGAQTYETGVGAIPAVRIGYNDVRSRIVVDVASGINSYNVSENGNEIVISVNAAEYIAPAPTEAPVTPEVSIQPYQPTEVVATTGGFLNFVTSEYLAGLKQASEADKNKIIMLDAGHGGTDPGAIGNINGVEINEKDLTLAITYKVKQILEENGYKTSMTRIGDTLPSLSERPAQANAENCALYVSIHINSADATAAHGTEVYYSEENNGFAYGVNSEYFAGNILNGMLTYMGSYNRGVKMANWAVIRRSNMPAILLEVGFISNHDELSKMLDDDYLNRTARGIAEGIVNTISSVNVP